MQCVQQSFLIILPVLITANTLLPHIVSSFMLSTWCVNLLAFKIMFTGIKVPAFTVPVGKSKDMNACGSGSTGPIG